MCAPDARLSHLDVVQNARAMFEHRRLDQRSDRSSSPSVHADSIGEPE
jgi:hypothetical protein